MSRSTTTAIHRVDVGEIKTWCGMKLRRKVGRPLPLPALRPRWTKDDGASRWKPWGEGKLVMVKLVTMDAYDCGGCLKSMCATRLREVRARFLDLLLERSLAGGAS